jgi:uncharacterized heparinase superfamily protein
MTGPSRFRFLSTEHSLENAGDWNRHDWARLWLYNLHYFDDMVADSAALRAAWHRDLIERWIRDNPPGHGTGWEPYPTSLRLVNWLKWALAGNTLPAEATQSIAVQARWLRRQLEVHLLGNHLLANAKALVFAGACFDGPEARAWRERGLALLRREIGEQILSDGGHFERSPMYHCIVLEDVLDLLQLARLHPDAIPATDAAAWRDVAIRMLRWLRVMTHPDGGIAFFNDAALAAAPDLAALTRHAAALDIPPDGAPLRGIEPLPASGYVRLQAGAAVLIADIGDIGPDYLPGHAHADTLGFELSIDGKRVVVNAGTSTYEAGPERQWQRGTAAHNTVTVGDGNSSEVWDVFRVARRARVRDVSIPSAPDGMLRASHDGYLRQGVSGMHHREWHLSTGALVITDRVVAPKQECVARIRLYPVVSSGPGQEPGTGTGQTGGHAVDIQFRGARNARVVDSTYHPAFGQSLACVVHEACFDERMTTEIRWSSNGNDR